MAWGYKCDRIIKLQKKAIRMTHLSEYNAHTEPILKSKKLLKVPDILQIQELKFYYINSYTINYLGTNVLLYTKILISIVTTKTDIMKYI